MKEILIGNLHRDIKEFILQYYLEQHPRARESDLYNKTAKVVVLDFSSIPEDEFYKMKPEQIATYSRLSQEEATKYPIVSEGKFMDGRHRITAMRTNGLKECEALDLTGIIKPEQDLYTVRTKPLNSYIIKPKNSKSIKQSI